MSFEKQLGDSFPEYRIKLNLAHIHAVTANNYILGAEQILFDKSQMVLDNKKDFKQLINTLNRLLNKVDNLEHSEKEDAFFSASDFLYKFSETTALKTLTKEDEIKILSYIQNNF